ncbi:putative purine permease 11-like isoform X1 [Hibiscus syriacus]|uniref:Purine permease 11-like isoform X1 n=1 Tax=Hibiscus syriacus TaxID=106335 RepID=A0A6A3A958_HIBSY|nr:putative purine permease 11-like isoform X1 [Hibiscus syriacus]
MRCKKHLTDLSSRVGVCATCLRERLLSLIAAQTKFERAAAAVVAEDRRKHEPPPLVFPRSVSPYVSWRKSDGDGATWIHHQRFYATPQVGLTTSTTSDFDAASTSFKKKHRFSLFSNLFGTRSEGFNSDPRVHRHREPCNEQSFSSSSSPSWFSAIFTAGRRNQQSSRTSRVEYCSQFGRSDQKSCIDRGMSPAIQANSGGECDRSPPESSPEVSPRWKRTPTAGRKARTGARNKSGMAFCLSPLVRASPNRQWNLKGGLSPEMTYTSESRPPMKPHLATAAGFCANRSKKIADFGRVNSNR